MNEEIKPENVRIHSRADELIACLEGEIAKRDEELAACRVAVENCEVFRARIAELEDLVISLQCKAIESDELRAELAALKAQGVVMPDVNAAAKALCNRHAMICGVDVDDQWKQYSQDFIADAETVLANARLNAAPAAPAADAWIPVSERLPDSGSTVIAYYLNSYGKGRTIRAQHVEAWTIEAEDVADVDTDCVEYSEQDDCYYLLQGWYECIDNWDEYYRVAVTEGPITHWMPLPAGPVARHAKGVV